MKDVIEYSPSIYVVKELLSAAQCDALIQLSENKGYIDAPITTRSGPVMDKSMRNNTRVILDSIEQAQNLWDIAAPYVKKEWKGKTAKDLNERLRFYRYDPGEQFDWHYDGYYERPNGDRSQFTLIIYLNDEFTGGETQFDNAEVPPAMGDALFFWHHQNHRGSPVTSGRKYVVRTDVMYTS